MSKGFDYEYWSKLFKEIEKDKIIKVLNELGIVK